MKTPVVEIPLVGAKVTDRNRDQTEQLCRYYGYEYIAGDEPGPPIAKFEGVNEGGPFVLVVALIEGSFTPDQVYEMLEKKGVCWGYWSMPRGDEEADQAIHRFASFWRGGKHSSTEVWGWLTCGEGARLLVKTRDPHDLTAAMDALIALEMKKKQDAAKP